MATPARMKGYGTTLGYASTVGGSYTSFTGMQKSTGPKPKAARTKNHDLSAVTQVVTSQKGWIDPGELSFVLFFDKAQYNTLLGFFTAGTEKFWKYTYPLVGAEVTASIMTFPGYIADMGVPEVSTDDENLVMCEVTVQLNDVPTFTAGS